MCSLGCKFYHTLEYIEKMFKDFLKNYKVKDSGLGFESTEIEVELK
jgi:hypothetical protein